MQKTLEDLYYGNISPTENLRPRMPEFKKRQQAACREEQAFMEKLSSGQGEEFQSVMMNRMDLSLLETVQAFVDGFKLGARLTAEVLAGDKAI